MRNKYQWTLISIVVSIVGVEWNTCVAQDNQMNATSPRFEKLVATPNQLTHTAGVSAKPIQVTHSPPQQSYPTDVPPQLQEHASNAAYYIQDPAVQTASGQLRENIPARMQSVPQGVPARAHRPELAGASPIDLQALNEAVSPNPASTPEKINLGQTIQKIGISTLCVLAICIGLLFVVKRFGVGMPATGSVNSNQSHIVDTLPLGQKASLQIVRIRKQEVLVARDASGIKSITCLPMTFDDEPAEANRRAA